MIQTSFVIITQAGTPCKWCDKAAEELDKRGVPYMLRPLARSKLLEAAERAKMKTVPIIYHGVKKIGGYEEMVEYLDALKN